MEEVDCVQSLPLQEYYAQSYIDSTSYYSSLMMLYIIIVK